MSESSNAPLFYKAYKSISARANEAHKDYKVAKDVANRVSKPRVPDFPGSKDVLVVEKQMEMYNALQARVRFYRERWNRLDNSAKAALAVWMDMVENEND
jgi:hypothetical protein